MLDELVQIVLAKNGHQISRISEHYIMVVPLANSTLVFCDWYRLLLRDGEASFAEFCGPDEGYVDIPDSPSLYNMFSARLRTLIAEY